MPFNGANGNEDPIPPADVTENLQSDAVTTFLNALSLAKGGQKGNKGKGKEANDLSIRLKIIQLVFKVNQYQKI